MPLYMVSYDIPKENPSYTKIVNYLESIKAKKVLESQWLVENKGNAEIILTTLTSMAEQNDHILVQKVDASDYAQYNLLLAEEDMFLLCLRNQEA